MKTFTFALAVQAALIAATVAGTSTGALADIKDYKFELVDQSVQAGPDKIITVRLVNTKTGKPVPDAVIFASRLDMAPDGMTDMSMSADMPCCPDDQKSNDCQDCPLVAMCVLKTTQAGPSEAVALPLRHAIRTTHSVANDVVGDGLVRPPPDQPPRTLA